MKARGTDTSGGLLSEDRSSGGGREGQGFTHFPVEDGSCRPVPTADLQDRARLLLWTRVHSRFIVEQADARDGPGLLTSERWREQIARALHADIEKLGGGPSRSAANLLARLLTECPPLAYIEPFTSLVVRALADRDGAFADALKGQFSPRQKKAERAKGGQGQLRQPSIRDWETVERWRLRNGAHGLDADCRRIAAETMGRPEGHEATAKEAQRLAKSYRRAANAEGAIKVFALAIIGCPSAQDGREHVGPIPPDVEPRIEGPSAATKVGPLLQVFQERGLQRGPT